MDIFSHENKVTNFCRKVGNQLPADAASNSRKIDKWAVRKVSGHFKYLENQSRGLVVTWQPVRGDLTVHP